MGVRGIEPSFFIVSGLLPLFSILISVSVSAFVLRAVLMATGLGGGRYNYRVAVSFLHFGDA